jgi:putative cardiolipin synthase
MITEDIKALVSSYQPLHDVREFTYPLIPKLLRAIMITLMLVGCASLPTDYQQTPSAAFKHPEVTTLGRLFAPSMARHPGHSGFLVLNESKDALLARIALAEVAEHTIDAQYFILKGDVTGKIFLERLLRAADRGIRVRLLIDDIEMGGKESNATAFDAHPNIEVRIFNPFATRGGASIRRGFELVVNLSRLNYRMHNKLFAVDNQVGIIGGRNIGDAYFGVDPKSNFRDLEVMAVGPIVEDLSEGFDTYWNSDWAIPISAFSTERPSAGQVDEIYHELRSFVADQADFPYRIPVGKQNIIQKLSDFRDEFIWAFASVTYDNPEKVRGDTSQNVGIQLRKIGDAVQREVLIVSPYFVPPREGMETLDEIRNRDVKIRILTNSLASTNATVVHSGYAKYRRRVLWRGVELFELRPDAASRNIHTADPSLPHRLTLHIKAAVFDRRVVYIGSYNFDRRGANLSTETGLLVYSPELAQKVTAFVEADMQPENSWQIIIEEETETGSGTHYASGELVWITERDGKEVRYRYEPGASFGRRFGAFFFSLFPIDDQL